MAKNIKGRERFIMQISLQVKPNSNEDSVEVLTEFLFKIYVKAKPVRGKANKSIINVLSEFLEISPRQIAILRGTASNNKLVKLFLTEQETKSVKYIISQQVQRRL